MPAASELLALLSRALDQVGVVIGGIRSDQAALATPCRSWDVRALVGHLLQDLRNFTVRAAGGTPDWAAAGPEPGEDWQRAFGEGAAGLLAAWRRAGNLEGTVELQGMGEVPARFPVDQQITELAVHAWDLARATGQTPVFDEEVGHSALEWAMASLRPEFRGDEAEGKAFGPQVTAPPDAPVYDRLAAFFGRAL